MTKVSVFGQPTEQKELKPIEFVKIMFNDATFKCNLKDNPSDYGNVQLFGKKENEDNYDIILALDDDDPSYNSVFLGHWNDGVVK